MEVTTLHNQKHALETQLFLEETLILMFRKYFRIRKYIYLSSTCRGKNLNLYITF